MRALLPLLLVAALTACDTAGGDATPIVRYAGPAITEADAVVVDDLGPRAWSGLTIGDAVRVSRTALCGDECRRTVALRFEGRGPLPVRVEATIQTEELLPERTEERRIELDRVEVQDWGPDVFSGVAYPTSRDHAVTAPIVFWATDLPPAAY